MFQKRKRSFERQVEAMEKARDEPRCVSDTDLFLKIRAMQQKGIRNDPSFKPSSVPLC